MCQKLHEDQGIESSFNEQLKEIVMRHMDAIALAARDSTLPFALTRFEVENRTLILLCVPPIKLPRQQREIVQMVGEGLSNKIIARKLGIKPSTVASHLLRIFRKFNVNSRSSLASRSFWLTFIDPVDHQ
jgi:DNA-binding NarL/FixJ family response regulator